MSLVDRTGTFRGVITDHAVSLTTNQFPQLVAQLQGLEYFDDDEKVWVDWSDVDEREITAYMVLFGGKDKETLTCKQIKKVTGWSGKSFTELNDMDMSEIKLQFRVVEHTYNENTSMQVEWIDEYDATPGRSVRKLEKKELAELDAKYKPILTATSGGVTPAKAPTKPKAKPKAPKNGPPTAKEAVEAEKALLKAPPARTDLPAGKCSRKEAWDICVDLKYKAIGSEKLAQVWNTTVERIAGKTTPDSKVTDEQWFLIKEAVLDETAAF